MNCASWNLCRGTYSKEREVFEAMEEHDLDCMMLQETDLADYDEKRPLTAEGFLSFTHKGNKKRAITLVRTRRFSNCELNTDLTQSDTTVWVNLTLENGKKVIIGNIYREWKEKPKTSIPTLMRKIDQALSLSSSIIVAGDFNLDFNRQQDSSYQHRSEASQLSAALSERGLSCMGFGNTFQRCILGKMTTSALDWVFHSPLAGCAEGWRKESGASDHAMIGWSFNATSNGQTQTVKRRNLKRIDKEGFLLDLAMKEWEQLVRVDIHKQAEVLNAFLMESLNRFAPLQEIRIKRRRTPKPSKALRDLRRKRDNARRYPTNREAFRALRNKCVLLGRKENLAFNQIRLSEDRNNAWKIIKEMTGQASSVPATFKRNGTVLNSEEAAMEFNDFFLKKPELIKSRIPPTAEDPLKGAKERAKRLELNSAHLTLRCVSEQEVGRILRKLKKSSCPDVDGISPDILKLAAPVLCTPLTFIINTSIESQVVPDAWKRAKLLPLHKKGAKTDITNYRPVSILPSPSKVLEEVVRSQLSKYCEDKHIIPASQHGFRSKRSTTTAVCAAHHDWKKAKDDGLEVGALFFDLSAAFDLIDTEILTAKLRIYGADNKMRAWLTSYLTGRSQQVLFGGSLSTEAEVRVGSPQGSILSPLLFLILTADMPEWVTDAELTTYADDTTVYAWGKSKAEVRSKLEAAAQEVLSFMAATGLAANAEKTKFIMFSRIKEVEPLTIGGARIKEGQQEPLLGFVISKDTKWSKHFEHLSLELRKRIGLLRRLRFNFPVNVLIQMMPALFTSRLLYGLEMFTNAPAVLFDSGTDTILKRLQVLQNEAMRAVLGKGRKDRVSQHELLKRTGQISVLQLSTTALARQAWSCFQGEIPDFLVGRVQGRTDSDRVTRAATRSDFPTQGVQDSLVSRMVKMWNRLPDSIRTCDKQGRAKRTIRLFAQGMCSIST